MAANQLAGSTGKPRIKDGGRGDERRGLSVHWLADHLMRDLAVTEEETVHNIEKRIRAKGERATCPRDGRLGAAYVDVAEDKHANVATLMLSYTWEYLVTDIISSISAYCNKHKFDAKPTCVWICCFCVNQHRVKEAKVSVDDFMRVFGERVKSNQRIVGMLSPWNKPKYVKRVWCLFESWKASRTKGIELDFVLPPAEKTKFQKSLKNGVADIWKALSSIQVQDAGASVEEDKQRILEVIKEDGGDDPFEKLNGIIMNELQRWFVDAARDSDLVKPGKDFDPEYCVTIADMMTRFGRNAECATFLEATIKDCMGDHDKETIDDEDARQKNIQCAMLHLRLGRNRGTSGDQEKAQKHCMTAYTMLEQSRQPSGNPIPIIQEAEVLQTLASISRKSGDLKDAFERYGRALYVYHMQDGGKLPEAGAWSLINLGIVWGLFGESQEDVPRLDAMKDTGYGNFDDFQYFDKAWEVYEQHQKLDTPAVAWLHRNRGVSYFRLYELDKDTSKLDKAKNNFDAAKKLYTELGQLDVENYGELRKSQGMLHLAMKEHAQATVCFEDARRVLREVMKDHSLLHSLDSLVYLYVERNDKMMALEAMAKAEQLQLELNVGLPYHVHEAKQSDWMNSSRQFSERRACSPRHKKAFEESPAGQKKRLLQAFKKANFGEGDGTVELTCMYNLFKHLDPRLGALDLKGFLKALCIEEDDQRVLRPAAAGAEAGPRVHIANFVSLLYGDLPGSTGGRAPRPEKLADSWRCGEVSAPGSPEVSPSGGLRGVAP